MKISPHHFVMSGLVSDKITSTHVSQDVSFDCPIRGGNPATFESLPTELITMVVRELSDDKTIEFKRPDARRLLDFLIFLEVRPQIRRLIRELCLNTASDVAFVMPSLALFTRILSCLPSLRTLVLHRIWFEQKKESDSYDTRVDRSGPYPLELLVMDRCLAGSEGTFGAELFAIISLFTLDTLFLPEYGGALPRALQRRSRLP
ncbi:hypothetical protein BD414DRAFT_541169 [Trametes punicea]|nr:hypothetical protein BD414DRAFT_541169 [Trametes punicea]